MKDNPLFHTWLKMFLFSIVFNCFQFFSNVFNCLDTQYIKTKDVQEFINMFFGDFKDNVRYNNYIFTKHNFVNYIFTNHFVFNVASGYHGGKNDE